MSERVALTLTRRLRASRPDASPARRVIDAFASGHAIHWPAAERLARSARARGLTRQLRLVAALAGETEGRGDRSVTVTTLGSEALVASLTVVAIAQVVVALPAAIAQAGTASTPVLAAMLAVAGAAVVTACLGGRERTSPAIGLALWLTAAGVARTLLADASIAPAWLGAAARGFAIESFLPVALWRLAAETPQVVRFARFDVASRCLHAVALIASGVMAVLSVPAVRDAGAPEVVSGPTAIWTAAAVWAVALLAVMAARSRGASPFDRRRLGWHALIVAMAAVLLTMAQLPSVAASVLTCAAAAALPWLAARACVPFDTTPAAALRSSWSGLRRLHASRDRDADLARLATAMQRARTPREVAATLARGLCDALGAPTAAVLARGEGGWTPLDGSPLALEPDSALSAVIDRADEPARVDRRSPLFALLPSADRDWLASSGVEAVVRLSAADGQTMAGLLVGGRTDHRRYGRRDLVFMAAAAATAAIALDACARTGREIGAQAVEEEFAFECGACGRIDAQPGVCRCGAPRQLAALPMQLAGKFRLERRLGRGGMGVVYLAVDRVLGRLVALKTLPRLSGRDVSALHAEARAMAALDHPSVAVVYGLETWHDTPVLVAEYLARGTLAARLVQGPLPLRDALANGIVLADTLAELHARGWLHRDIKPSNIGIGRGDAPKLLDFGLTRLIADPSSLDADSDDVDAGDAARPRPLAGTPLYLSPEALDGQPAGEDVDVWALALVVFEMITGTHPYRATTFKDVLRQVRRTSTIDVRALAPATPAPVAEAIAAALHPDRAHRLVSARAFGAALRAAVPSDEPRC